MPETADPLLLPKEAARRLGISRPTLVNLMNSRQIRFVRLPGRGEKKNRRIPASAVTELIERATVNTIE